MCEGAHGARAARKAHSPEASHRLRPGIVRVGNREFGGDKNRLAGVA